MNNNSSGGGQKINDASQQKSKNIKKVSKCIEEQIEKFKNRFIAAYKIIRIAANKNVRYWLGIKGTTNNVESSQNENSWGSWQHRRLYYIYNRTIESLAMITEDLHKYVGKNNIKNTKKIINKLKGTYKKFIRHSNYDKLSPEPLDRMDVIRRLAKANSELAPLLITSLDAELFTACFVLHKMSDALMPFEKAQLYERIWQQNELYLTRQLQYHDLSTLWWGVKIILNWQARNLDERIGKVRALIEFSLSQTEDQQTKPSDIFLNPQAEKFLSYDRNGDLNTYRRSLLYCFQNAVEIREWMANWRNPQLDPLIQALREWSDYCASLWYKIDKPKRLYDAALDIAFCAQLWKDRVKVWNDAIHCNIINKKNLDKNQSKVPGIVTTNQEFADILNYAFESIKKYVNGKGGKHPLVIGLFGPPGVGKTALAKAVSKECAATLKIVNLSVFEECNELYRIIGNITDYVNKKLILFFDEFDVKNDGDYWFSKLLTILWDGEVPSTDKNRMQLLQNNTVIFLAASRYERFNDFRDFALSEEAKDYKAADLLSRIDITLDLPRPQPEDRVLIMLSRSECKADEDVLILCYIAEMEDNARGIEKLLKGVDKSKKITCKKLPYYRRESLYRAAGLHACLEKKKRLK